MPKKKFKSIVDEINCIDIDSLKLNFNFGILGKSSSISVGNLSNGLSYRVGSPRKKEELNYYNTWKQILEFVNIDPKIFLRDEE